MGLRGHGGAIAITAVVTMVIASAGTAVAVTSQVVTISDPTNLARKARVDAAGRLSVAPPTATVSSSNLLATTNGDNFVTSPTTATLGITRIGFSNPSFNASASSAEVRYYLYQVGVSGGACSSAVSPVLLGIYNIAPGDDVDNEFATPLIVKAAAAAPYCLDLYAQTLSGAYNASYLPSWEFAAVVVAGQYTPAKAAAPTGPEVIAEQEKAATH